MIFEVLGAIKTSHDGRDWTWTAATLNDSKDEHDTAPKDCTLLYREDIQPGRMVSEAMGTTAMLISIDGDRDSALIIAQDQVVEMPLCELKTRLLHVWRDKNKKELRLISSILMEGSRDWDAPIDEAALSIDGAS